MIAKTDAISVLKKNLERTESLISAMDKIDAYNRIYRDNLHHSYSNQRLDNPGKSEEEQSKRLQAVQSFVSAVKDSQDRELEGIKRSCGEHAIISLATAFETYYKELVQELLWLAPEFFTSQNTSYTECIRTIIEETESRDYEEIGENLKLHSRKQYYKFFDCHSIPFLSTEERDFIEQIYSKRNNFVHNAGKEDTKLQKAREKTSTTQNDPYIDKEAKKLRTKFKRMMFNADKKLKLKFIPTSH